MKIAFIVILAAWITVIGSLDVSAQQPCTSEEKRISYQKFYDTHNGDEKQIRAAAVIAKDYLAKFGACPSEADTKISAFLKTWLARFDLMVSMSACEDAAYDTPAKAFEICRPWLAKEPDSLKAHLLLTAALINLKPESDPKIAVETVKVAKRTLELIKAGKKTDSWILSENEKEAIASVQFYFGFFATETSPVEAISALLEVARSGTKKSSDPWTYFAIATTAVGEYQKLLTEFKAKCNEKTINTPSCASMEKSMNAYDIRIIDAMTRSYVLSKDRPDFANKRADMRKSIEMYYQDLPNKYAGGIDEFINGILSRPIP